MPIRQVAGPSQSGPKGPAQIRVVGKSFNVAFDDGDQFSFPLADSPIKGLKSGKYYVSVSGRGDKVYDIRPLAGTFPVKFSHWAAKDGQPPTIRRDPPGARTLPSGLVIDRKVEELSCTAILEIVDGDKKGMQVPLYLDYRFIDAGDGTCALRGTKGKGVELLTNFLTCSGIDPETDTIPFSENVLPALGAMIVRRKKNFQASLKPGKGYVAAVAPMLEVGRTRRGRG